MKARLKTLTDGTVTICIEPENDLERQLLLVFCAQTYRVCVPAQVLHLGSGYLQLMAQDRVHVADEEPKS
jgi:hypothetical protein